MAIQYRPPHHFPRGDTHDFFQGATNLAGALYWALREHPAVILVGAMRDRERIQLTPTRAETGRLVSATLGPNDAGRTRETTRRPSQL